MVKTPEFEVIHNMKNRGLFKNIGFGSYSKIGNKRLFKTRFDVVQEIRNLMLTKNLFKAVKSGLNDKNNGLSGSIFADMSIEDIFQCGNGAAVAASDADIFRCIGSCICGAESATDHFV